MASARQHPENQKENQAGHSSERTVEGQIGRFSYYPRPQMGGEWGVLPASGPKAPVVLGQ